MSCALRDLVYRLLRGLARVILRLTCRLTVTGLDRLPARGGFLLASNHVSYLDPVVIAATASRQLEFIARDDLFRVGWLGWFLRCMRVVRISQQETFGLRSVIHLLRSGRAVVIFPEGGLQMTGALGQPHPGAAWLAARAGVPVVPVLVRGTFEAMPPKTVRLRPGANIRVAFGAPIQYPTGRFSGTPSPAVDSRLAQAWDELANEPAGKQKGS
jgi:1-acyl-sn-glycerol-3-phosphate acyltransferase